jgi:hypothetical protein
LRGEGLGGCADSAASPAWIAPDEPCRRAAPSLFGLADGISHIQDQHDLIKQLHSVGFNRRAAPTVGLPSAPEMLDLLGHTGGLLFDRFCARNAQITKAPSDYEQFDPACFRARNGCPHV